MRDGLLQFASYHEPQWPRNHRPGPLTSTNRSKSSFSGSSPTRLDAMTMRPISKQLLGAPELVRVGAEPHATGQCLVWRMPRRCRGISSAIVGGGIGDLGWVINFTVDADYSRMDPAAHVGEVVGSLGLVGPGSAFMTAVDVANWVSATDTGAEVYATVGVRLPVWAADRSRSTADEDKSAVRPGTINLVAAVPQRLCDAALVNVVATMTEAKAQALADHRIDGTGTASDAVCVVCPSEGETELFGGPRSQWGSRLAIATYDAVSAGLLWQRSKTAP